MVEFYLICSVLILLSVFVFFSNNVVTSGEVLGVQINYLGSFLLLSVMLLYLNLFGYELSNFSNSFLRESISVYLGLLGSVGTFLICFLSVSYLSKNSLFEYEFFLVVSLVMLGSYFLIFSNDLLSLYLGIELQSLGLYTLAAMKTNSSYSTEAGLKYFVLGAFASSLLVFGIVFFYGVTGLLNFEDILYFFFTMNTFWDNSLMLSVIFICVSLIFKIGGAPFHSWVPDVYEGVATIVTFFFALVPKISIVSVLLKLSYLFHVGSLDELSNLLLYCGILSVFVGSLGAIGQTRLKRVLSYSAIGHGGFLLWGLSLGSVDGYVSLLFYISIYCALVVMLFSSLLGLQQKVNSSTLKLVGNLSLIYKANFWLSVSFLMALFSILGIPPLSGFFSKLLVLVAGINEGYWLVAGLFIITSVVSSVYYLRLIKSLVFSQKSKSWALFFSVKKHFSFIVSLFLMFNLLFIFVGNSFLQLVYGLVYDYSMADIFFIDSLRSGLQRVVDQAIIDTNLFFNDGRQLFRIPLKWYEIIKASMPFRRSAAEDLAERAEACKQFLYLMEGLANTPVIPGQKMSEFNKELLQLIIIDDCKGLGYEMRYEDSMRIKNNIKWLLELNYPPKAIRAVLLKAEWGIKGPGFTGPARFILVVNK